MSETSGNVRPLFVSSHRHYWGKANAASNRSAQWATHLLATTALISRTADFRTEIDLSSVARCPVRHCRTDASISYKLERSNGMMIMPNMSKGVRNTHTADGRIILDIHRGQMLSVNVVGSRILELLERGWNEDNISDEISQAYGTALDVVRSDVREFVESLRRHHIVQPSVPTDAK